VERQRRVNPIGSVPKRPRIEKVKQPKSHNTKIYFDTLLFMIKHTAVLLTIAIMSAMTLLPDNAEGQKRARDLGITPGILQPGPWNAITDVEGVMVGHQTIIRGDNIRTGVTAILPHGGNLFTSRVPAAVYVGNGFGKAVGFTQVQELGELETPVVLTNTLSVFMAAHGLADYMLSLPENEHVRSVNAVAGETNDGWLNDIRERAITPDDVFAAIAAARSGPVAEGNVGAGTGTRALGFKAGIGTSSRELPASRGGYTVGVLVQSNFGGILQIDGAPVGVELGNFYMSDEVPYRVGAAYEADSTQYRNTSSESSSANPPVNRESITGTNSTSSSRATSDAFDVDGSVMIIVATDAPLTARNLERLARRAFMALARVGGFASNGSGDYIIAFSTHPDVRVNPASDDSTSALITNIELRNADTTPLFLAAVEATEEALLNSLFMAETMQGYQGRTMPALPTDKVLEILRKYRVID
jgi:D-aminopeptidase